MTRPRFRLAAALLTGGLLIGACADETDTAGPPPSSPDSAAATVRVTVDRLFREYVYLLALATENTATGQSKPAAGATAALEENALAIADQFETVYGDAAEKSFLLAWRPIAVTMTAYTTARVRRLRLPAVDRALARIPTALGNVARLITPLIDPTALVGRAKDFIAAIRAVVDAQAASDFTKADLALRAAADRAGDVGFAFSRAFVDELPALFPGNPLSAGATFRTQLEGLLVEHVFLTGMTAENLLTAQAKPQQGARAALDANADAIAKHLGTAYGPTAETALAPAWRRLVELLVGVARASKDQAALVGARAALDQYVDDFTAVIAGMNALLKPAVVERLIGTHIDGVIAAARAQAAGDFKTGDLGLRAAAAGIEAFGAAVSAATIERFRARFGRLGAASAQTTSGGVPWGGRLALIEHGTS